MMMMMVAMKPRGPRLKPRVVGLDPASRPSGPKACAYRCRRSCSGVTDRYQGPLVGSWMGDGWTVRRSAPRADHMDSEQGTLPLIQMKTRRARTALVPTATPGQKLHWCWMDPAWRTPGSRLSTCIGIVCRSCRHWAVEWGLSTVPAAESPN